jgi:dihydrofolate reductase
MRKIIAAAFVSIDGVMQAPGGPNEDPSGGFEFGGWLAPHFDEVVGKQIGGLFDQPFDLLLGRKTYEIFAAYWPYFPKDADAPGYDPFSAEIARTFDRITKYVASRSNPKLDWQNSELLEGDVAEALRALKQGDGPDLLTQGSSNLLQTLFQTDLVDELHVLTFPVVLGKGKRLFEGGAAPMGFRLAKSVASPSGVVIASYERAGAVQTGNAGPELETQAELERRAKLEA